MHQVSKVIPICNQILDCATLIYFEYNNVIKLNWCWWPLHLTFLNRAYCRNNSLITRKTEGLHIHFWNMDLLGKGTSHLCLEQTSLSRAVVVPS